MIHLKIIVYLMNGIFGHIMIDQLMSCFSDQSRTEYRIAGGVRTVAAYYSRRTCGSRQLQERDGRVRGSELRSAGPLVVCGVGCRLTPSPRFNVATVDKAAQCDRWMLERRVL